MHGCGLGKNCLSVMGLGQMKIFEIADKFAAFISEVGEELKKSAWPTRPELLESTVMVIVSVVMLAFFVGVCDLVLMRLLKLVI